ncbi:MAG: putative DNA binding domain-containing protein [Candidatus Symbiothrix sp.]|jgi:ATP-dependent DNA helicase RecG|nr:putative DNA binding domain-containing protein [Candidatus Symbiothrix sp.]
MNDSDLIDLLKDLCAQPREQQWLEFKSNGIDHEQTGEYISAMSNGATLANKPFGYLVWGVEDITHVVKGTTFTFAEAKHGNQDLELWLRLYLDPKINFEIFEFDCEGKRIVLMRIPTAKSEPTHFQKKPFIRVGSNKTDLRKYPDWMRIIYNSQEDWSAKIIEKASIGDLDPQALKMAREKFKEKNPNFPYFNQIDTWDDATFLDKARISIDRKITNTALLLLGKPEATHYLLPSVAEITWKLDTEEKAYEHFTAPFFLTTTQVMQRIRSVQIRFYPEHELLATTVNKYDTKSILEAIHNCIAHQDYSLRSRIIVTEKIDKLIFTNAGNFFEGTPEEYSLGEKTPKRYRNPWLVNAMSNLGMIDHLGYGIHSLYVSQRNRFFPMPDYILSDPQEVIMYMYGQTIDENYPKLLIERRDLSLSKVTLLDKVQKKTFIPDASADALRKERLIEGRKPNYFVGKVIAQATDKKADYSKNAAFSKQQYFDWILKSIEEHGSLSRKDIDELLWNMLPAWMDIDQKKNRIKNLIAELRQNEQIINSGTDKMPEWTLNLSVKYL